MAEDITMRLRLVDEFSSVAARARSGLRELSAGAREFGDGFREGARQARDAEGAIRSAGAASERAGRAQYGFAGMLKTAAGGLAALGLANAAKDMVSFGLQTAAANEQAQISFTTLLGSGEKAKSFVGELQQFAAKTPFEMAGLQKSSSMLLAAGVNADKVIPIMTTLGNVTSGMGTGSEGIERSVIALQQMNAAGKITGEDLNQLRDAGIPVYDLLAAATGKSKEQVVELAQAGKLGKKELGQMMTALESSKGLERFNGLMEAQSNSLLGLWSSFKDNLGQSLGKLIEPAIPGLKAGLKWLGDTIGGIPDMLSSASSQISANPFVKTVSDVLNKVRGAGELLLTGDFTGEIGDLLGAGEDSTLVDTLLTIRDGAVGLYNLVVKGDFTGAFRRAFNLEEDSPVVAKILEIRDKAMELVGVIRDRVGPLWDAAWGSIQTGAQRAKDIITWIWQRFGENILNILSITFEMLKGIMSGAFTVLTGIFNFFKSLFTGDWAGMWEAVKQVFSGIWDIVVSLLKGAWGLIVEVVKAGGGLLLEKLGELGGWVVGKFTEMKDGIVAALRGLGGLLWDHLAKPALDALNAVIEAANKIPGVSIGTVNSGRPDALYRQQDFSGTTGGNPLADTVTSMWSGGAIGNTLAAYRAMGSGLGISNVWIGGGGKGRGSGDHQAGRALDLIGPMGRMQSFISRATAAGDFAQMHGSGASRHVHYVPRNWYGSTSSAPSLVRGGMGDTASSMAGVYIAPGAIVVQGSGDPEAVASAVMTRIQRQIANARERR